MLDSRYLLAVARGPACCDQDVSRADSLAVGQLNRVGVGERRPCLHDLNAGAIKSGRIGRLQPRNLFVLVGDERRPIERRMRKGPAIASSILELATKARGIDQKLFRHAAADDASTAHAVLLRYHDAGAMLGGDARSTHATRPTSNDEEIDVVIRHARCRARVFSFHRASWQ